MKRAFVVQFSFEGSPGEATAGRVEHVRSGRAIHFTSLIELLQFFAESIEREARDDKLQQRAAARAGHPEPRR